MSRNSTSLHLLSTIPATPEQVFAAWTGREKVERWTHPDPSAGVEVDVDLRVGGRYSICLEVEDGHVTAHGTYREVDPPRRRNARGQNHGRESSKVIQDCMIRPFCRCAGSCWIVPE